jgi:hypothetical protein
MVMTFLIFLGEIVEPATCKIFDPIFALIFGDLIL